MRPYAVPEALLVGSAAPRFTILVGRFVPSVLASVAPSSKVGRGSAATTGRRFRPGRSLGDIAWRARRVDASVPHPGESALLD